MIQKELRLMDNIEHNTGEKNREIRIRVYLLAIYLFVAPLDFLSIIPGVALPKLLVFLPIAGCLFDIKKARICFDRYFIIPIIYLFMIVLSSFYSVNVSDTIQRISSVGLNILAILFLCLFDYRKDELIFIKKSIVWSGWLTLGLMTFFADKSLFAGRLTVRINGSYQDPNYLCGFLIFAIVFYLKDFFEKRTIKEVLFAVIFVIFIILTGSRGGLIAVYGSILFFTFLWMKKQQYNLVAIIKTILLITLIFIFCIQMVKVTQPQSVVQRYSIEFSQKDGGAHRIDILKSMVHNYKSASIFHRLFGFGAGTIRHFTYNGNVGHNIWIESLLEIGLIGTGILLIFYLVYMLKIYRIQEYVIFSGFVGYMIMGSSLSLYSYKPIWNIILLIMLSHNNEINMRRCSSRGNNSYFKCHYMKERYDGFGCQYYCTGV